MRKLLIDLLNFPKATVADRHIPKKAFFDNANLTKSEINLFTADIEGVYLLSIMNPDQLNIAPYQMDDVDYREVYWFHVHLREDKQIQRIAAAIHGAFPNPVTIIFSKADKLISLSAAHKRLNKTKTMLEEPVRTDWFSVEPLADHYEQLLVNITTDYLSQENLYQFYDDIYKWVKVEQMIKWINRLPEKSKINQVIPLIEKVYLLQNDMKQLQQEEKGQINFGDKMQVHMKKKKIEGKIKDHIEQLKGLC